MNAQTHAAKRHVFTPSGGMACARAVCVCPSSQTNLAPRLAEATLEFENEFA